MCLGILKSLNLCNVYLFLPLPRMTVTERDRDRESILNRVLTPRSTPSHSRP